MPTSYMDGEDPADAGPETRERTVGLSPTAWAVCDSRITRQAAAALIGWPVRGPDGEPQSYLLGRPQMQKAHRNGGPFC